MKHMSSANRGRTTKSAALASLAMSASMLLAPPLQPPIAASGTCCTTPLGNDGCEFTYPVSWCLANGECHPFFLDQHCEVDGEVCGLQPGCP